ncbi:hypothetical protein [Phenylobacterium sp. J367]|uniref:hypothetical protein n=1 Tax=Phenylobacterium sp. J367 TaxID=2898435 RepID=UPI0021511B9C|nr:hypothetical protein [Phenylobacterium sp. J367]MCR5877207.1 hypothetical protein [Phenylobacterium sp. J367]
MRKALLALFAALAGAAQAQTPPPALPVLQSEVIRRYKAPEATQGVAVDAKHFYAVANSRIAKYDKATGEKVGEWAGERARFPHINSCEVIGKELVCAASNYPQVPMSSSVEIFDPGKMVHLRTVSLGQQIGSLTWVDRKDGVWWATFANYEPRPDGQPGRGEPGRGSVYTQFVQFDDQWRRMQGWSFPETVLERFRPMSSSGGGWGPDGRLYITGHDHPELYVLALPAGARSSTTWPPSRSRSRARPSPSTRASPGLCSASADRTAKSW